MVSSGSLLDEVLEHVSNSSSGVLSWFDKLPPEAQAELLGVRAGFDPARHQKRAFYKAIKACAERRGWEIAGEKQVTQWLSQR
jgi:hypothetical protein